MNEFSVGRRDSNTLRDAVCRPDALDALARAPSADLVIIGGGIHGATVARIAAEIGFSVVLLEQADYAAATSSRSSKMAHGGLRYLEMFDFQQVFEGIKAREELFAAAPHLVRPERFLIPVPRGAYWLRAKLSVGLRLYDLMVQHQERKHRWIPRHELNFEGFHHDREDLMGCFQYTDGLLNDARLVFENVIAARRAGARTLNYVKVSQLHSDGDGCFVEAHDTVGGRQLELRAKLVVNCAGPWVGDIAGAVGDDAPQVKFSRGAHIIFSRPWRNPSLFLPMEGEARYYFVWPHIAGTMVGTTEREVDQAELDPLPSADELDEIFARLERDLPDSGLTRATAHYCFAGVRTLPLRRAGRESATLSRKHLWKLHGRVLTLFGGKYTTAVWTAAEAVARAKEVLGRGDLPAPSLRFTLPGSLTEERSLALSEQLTARGLSDEIVMRLLQRFGRRVESFLDGELDLSPLGPQLVEGEVRMALDVEQAETLEDVMRRRLDLEYMPHSGLEMVESIGALVQRFRPELDVPAEVARYRERIARIHELLRGGASLTGERAGGV